MSNRFDDALSQVAEETMMSLAFLFLLNDEETADVGDVEKVVASVDFSGPFAGALFVSAPTALLPELAANMLGFEEEAGEPGPEVQNDALKELLNVICGNLLPEIAGAEAVFKVHAPQVCGGGIPDVYLDQTAAGKVTLPIESGVVELVLFVESHALV